MKNPISLISFKYYIYNFLNLRISLNNNDRHDFFIGNRQRLRGAHAVFHPLGSAA